MARLKRHGRMLLGRAAGGQAVAGSNTCGRLGEATPQQPSTAAAEAGSSRSRRRQRLYHDHLRVQPSVAVESSGPATGQTVLAMGQQLHRTSGH